MRQPASFLAKPADRIVAAVLDAAFVLALGLSVGRAASRSGAGSAALLAVVVALYFVYHFVALSFAAGQALGKYKARISIVGSDGEKVSDWRALARGLVRIAPSLLLLPALDATSDFERVVGGLGIAAFIAFIGLDVLLVLRSPTRQTLADRLASTLVVEDPGPEPHRAPAAPMFSADDAEFGAPPKAGPRQRDA